MSRPGLSRLGADSCVKIISCYRALAINDATILDWVLQHLVVKLSTGEAFPQLTPADYITLLGDLSTVQNSKHVMDVVSKVGAYFNHNLPRFSAKERREIAEHLASLQYINQMAANTRISKSDLRALICDGVGAKHHPDLDLGHSSQDGHYSILFKKHDFSL